MSNLREPDFKNDELGIKAWQLPLNEGRNKDGSVHTGVACWLVTGPFHAFWDTWFVSCSHLRDVPGLPPLTPDQFHEPGNTHEFIILALNPGTDPNKRTVYDPDNMPFPVPHLTPPDCVVQFKVDNDVEAHRLTEAGIKMIIAGQISPDQDHRNRWKEVIKTTIECSKHPKNLSH